MTHSFKAVLFDMDGLLIDSERIYYETYQDTRRHIGLAPCHISFMASIGLRMAQARPIFETALEGVMQFEEFDAIWSQAVSDRLRQSVPLRPRVTDLLERLSTRQLPMAVVTSSGKNHAQENLQRAGILDHFQVVVAGDEVAQGKPHPEPYLTAARALGIDIKTCAAFEDSDIGVRAAIASGARAVQVPDLKPPTSETRALGHVIADDLIRGAERIGLIEPPEA